MCIYMLVAEADLNTFQTTNSAMLTFWILAYMILVSFILLNVFIAILQGYFRQIAPKSNEEQTSFLKLLHQMLIPNSPVGGESPMSDKEASYGRVKRLCCNVVKSKKKVQRKATKIFMNVLSYVLSSNQEEANAPNHQPPVNADVIFQEKRESDEDKEIFKDIQLYLGKNDEDQDDDEQVPITDNNRRSKSDSIPLKP